MQSNKKKNQTTKQKLHTHSELPPPPPSLPPLSSTPADSCCCCSSSMSSSTSPESTGPLPETEATPIQPVSSRVCEGPILMEHLGNQWAVTHWNVANFSNERTKSSYSPYFTIGGYDFRFVVYPKGDAVAMPGHCSLYLQAMDPRSSKLDCFVCYTLKFVNHIDDSMSVCRMGSFRFSPKKKSHGWNEFEQSSVILDTRFGFLINDTLTILGEIHVLDDNLTVSQDNNETKSQSATGSEALDGRITWRLNNFGVFKDSLKNQKLVSPGFQVGECTAHICVFRSWINGVEYFSMSLEDREITPDHNCWCLFRLSVLNQKQGLHHFYKESYGRFGADIDGGDGCSLGWIDYMKLSQLVDPTNGFLFNGTVVFTASFHVIKEFFILSKPVRGAGGTRKSDVHTGKFTWKIANFSRLKDLVKKKKMKNFVVKSRKFQIGNRECRLVVYPRGQSQPPRYLSMFLEVFDSFKASYDWSCFVYYRMWVINQRAEERSTMKESQSRFSTSEKEFGWTEFLTLASVFDQESGFLNQDVIAFSVELLILKETSILEYSTKSRNTGSFTWKVENFSSFKEMMTTRKIFSKHFPVGECGLRIGVYESFGILSTYLECDSVNATDAEKNIWVSYRMGVVNQKDHTRTMWKESSLCTKNWSSSVLQFIRVSDLVEPGSGYLIRDTVIFVCEIHDCCPWFDFSDLEVLAPQSADDTASSGSEKLVHSEEGQIVSKEEVEKKEGLPSSAGFHQSKEDNSSKPAVLTRRGKVPMDVGKLAVQISDEENEGSDSVRVLEYGRVPKVEESTCTCSEDQFMKEIPGDHFSPLDLDSIRSNEVDRAGHLEELLAPIVNSLETMERSKLTELFSSLLARAPQSLQPDLIRLIPKRIDPSEHPLVACALLDLIQKPDAEAALQPPARTVLFSQISTMLGEKENLIEKLRKSEATIHRLESEARHGRDKLDREKMAFSEHMGEMTTQLEKLRSEWNEKIAKLSTEKKIYQDRLREAEAQQSLLMSQKQDETKKVAKEKNALSERLKRAEATIDRLNQERKRLASEAARREEVQKSLENEVQLLKLKLEESEKQKRQKEGKIASYKDHVASMEENLNNSQNEINSLNIQLRNEMMMHAPLYGVGLQELSLQELETVSNIHEIGLREIHSLRQSRNPQPQ